MWRFAIFVVLVAACDFEKSPEKLDGRPVDGRPDGCTTFSTQLDTCVLPAGTELVISGSRVYSTDTHVLADPGGGNPVTVVTTRVIKGGDMMDVILATNFTLTAGSNLRVVGSVAFGIVATEAITIAGAIDAVGGDPLGSPVADAAGARKQTACDTIGGTDGGTDNGGAPGGGGAGFRGAGGNGGQGDSNGTSTAGGAGGPLEAVPTTLPRGGCHGGEGGSAGGSTRGAAGRGGGAVDLIAARSVTIAGSGIVNAGGGGGLGGKVTDGGGGGGGSGGMIVLEAPSVTGGGGVAANGGGGGGGGGNTASGPGAPGSVSMTPAPGGTAADSGSPGGAGGAGPTLGGVTVTDTTNAGGGGGGGGSAGYIRILGDATPTLGVISPAAS